MSMVVEAVIRATFTTATGESTNGSPTLAAVIDAVRQALVDLRALGEIKEAYVQLDGVRFPL